MYVDTYKAMVRTSYGCKRAVEINSYQIGLSRLIRKGKDSIIASGLLSKYNGLFKTFQSMAYNDDADYYDGKLREFEEKLDSIIPAMEKLAKL